MSDKVIGNTCPPVMICGFIRPDCLKKVFDRVREAKPAQLFLALDAPRDGRPKDVTLCEDCKKVFAEVDWPCEVHRNYAERNMGCKKRMESAITWVFEHVDRAIILEDDCVPDLTFFDFCEELLERYLDDGRIGGICGFSEHWSFARHPVKVDADYYFDRLNTCWGWATWKRAWRSYDANMVRWPELKRKRVFRDLCRRRYEERALERMVQSVYDGKCSSWATVWFLTSVEAGYLFAHAVNNLVENIGFGAGATHTTASSPFANVPIRPLSMPLKHPKTISANTWTEAYMLSHQYAIPLWRRAKTKIMRIIKGL